MEAKGKHLMIRFSGGLTLHTHMRMTGAWHIYGAGEKWRRPPHLARVVLECGDRIAVCFSAPVIELLVTQTEWAHPIIAGLGPDVMKAPIDVEEVKRRASEQPPDIPIGDLLLDQRVVSGIGNIWRNEALFACKVNPATPHTRVDLGEIVRAAARLMQARARPGGTYRPSVYNRAGGPCPRCGGRISAARQGEHRRTAYWCPRCQLL